MRGRWKEIVRGSRSRERRFNKQEIDTECRATLAYGGARAMKLNRPFSASPEPLR